MDLNINWSVIGLIAGALIALYVLGRWLLKYKALLRIIGSGLLGGSLIAAVNLLGVGLHLYIASNPVTCLLVGMLGMPGLIAVYLAGLIL